MRELAVWSLEGEHADSDAKQSHPKRVGRSRIGLEKHFEDWIASDVTLIGDGLTLVGRQVLIDDGKLDLLAIDSQDRWVVIEIKSGTVTTQALV